MLNCSTTWLLLLNMMPYIPVMHAISNYNFSNVLHANLTKFFYWCSTDLKIFFLIEEDFDASALYDEALEVRIPREKWGAFIRQKIITSPPVKKRFSVSFSPKVQRIDTSANGKGEDTDNGKDKDKDKTRKK